MEYSENNYMDTAERVDLVDNELENKPWVAKSNKAEAQEEDFN